MARRKAIYLELYPETGNGKTKGNQFTGQKRESDIVSFSQDTSAKTQTSKRTVERNVEIGEVLGDLQDEIRTAKIDDSQKDLLALAKLGVLNQMDAWQGELHNTPLRSPVTNWELAQVAATPSLMPCRLRATNLHLPETKRELEAKIYHRMNNF